MASYRVYFVDETDHILTAGETIEAADDAAAIFLAERLCREHLKCAAVELWEGTRKVSRHMREAAD
jgi:hypothetical protein